MSARLDMLEAEALKLTPADQARLLERPISSLDADSEVERAWAEEVDQREAELVSGARSAVSGPEAIARLRALILA